MQKTPNLSQPAPQQFDLGIACDFLLTMAGPIATQQFIGIQKDRITCIEPWLPTHQTRCKTFLHEPGQVVMPGLINGHTHLAMTLFRGLADDLPLQDWLFKYILPLEQQLVSAEFVRVGTELGLLEALQFGTTTLNDMYFFPDTIASAIDRSHLRGRISCPLQNSPSPDDSSSKKLNLNRARTLAHQYQQHDRISIGLGPHAPYSCDDTLLRETQALSESLNLPIHIHISESLTEVENSMRLHKKTPIARLHSLGLLHRLTSGAHAVHLSSQDIELLVQTSTSIIHNPESNMKLGSGAAPISTLLKAGVAVGIGTDGAASNNNLNLFGEMNTATLLQKLIEPDQTAFTAYHTLKLATLSGARALGLDHEIGSVEVGKKADLIFVNFNHPHLQPIHNLISQLVYSTTGMEVSTLVCNGRIVLQHGTALTLDAQKIYAEANVFRDSITRTVKTEFKKKIT